MMGHLSNLCVALGSNPSTANRKKKREKQRLTLKYLLFFYPISLQTLEKIAEVTHENRLGLKTQHSGNVMGLIGRVSLTATLCLQPCKVELPCPVCTGLCPAGMSCGIRIHAVLCWAHTTHLWGDRPLPRGLQQVRGCCLLYSRPGLCTCSVPVL